MPKMMLGQNAFCSGQITGGLLRLLEFPEEGLDASVVETSSCSWVIAKAFNAASIILIIPGELDVASLTPPTPRFSLADTIV